MPECVSSKCRLFADDSIIYREVRDPEDSNLLQEDLNRLHEWESLWGMSFNPSKCHIMHVTRKKQPVLTNYTLKGEVLSTVETATYLGVDISANLSWNNQIGKITKKSSRTLGFIKRNITTPSVEAKETAYKALVRPQLEYGACIWDPHTAHMVSSIERIQRRAARWVAAEYARMASVSAILARLGWETLEARRAKSRITMLYKIRNHLVAITTDQLIPSTSSTRRKHPFTYQQLHARPSYYHYSFYPWTIPLWNAMPSSLVEAETLEAFRLELAKVQLPALRH